MADLRLMAVCPECGVEHRLPLWNSWERRSQSQIQSTCARCLGHEDAPFVRLETTRDLIASLKVDREYTMTHEWDRRFYLRRLAE